jgi:hypothetical protein
MATATLRFQAQVLGLIEGGLPIDIGWTLPEGVVATRLANVSLPAGVHTNITPPNANTKMVIIVPPAASTNLIAIKGDPGDIGWALRPNLPNIVSWQAVALYLFVTITTTVDIYYL